MSDIEIITTVSSILTLISSSLGSIPETDFFKLYETAKLIESSKLFAFANTLGSNFERVALIFSFWAFEITVFPLIISSLASFSSVRELILALYSAALASIVANFASNSSFSTWFFWSALLVSPYCCSNSTYFFFETHEAKNKVDKTTTVMDFFIFVFIFWVK